MAACEEAARTFAESVGFVRRQGDRGRREERGGGEGRRWACCAVLWATTGKGCCVQPSFRTEPVVSCTGAPAVRSLSSTGGLGVTGPQITGTSPTGPQQRILGPVTPGWSSILKKLKAERNENIKDKQAIKCK